MTWIPASLREIRQQLEQGVAPTISVRKLLSWFHSERRGSRVVSSIHAALRDLELTTTPNFEDAWIDGEIVFSFATPRAIAGDVRPEPAPGATEPTSASPDVPPELPYTSDPSPSPGLPAGPDVVPTMPLAVVPPPAPEVSALHARHDPVYRIGKLAAANHRPESVHLDTPLSEAVTRMMRRDFDQLPVLSGLFRVEGAVTWKSIVRSYTLRVETPLRVRDCLDYAPECSANVSVFEAIDSIIQHGFTLVRGKQGIQGIVTLADLATEFHGSLEPFILIGEIERHLRQLLDRRLSLDILRGARDPNDNREIVSAADLSFGQYRRLLERPDLWELCGLRVDRTEFIRGLEQMRLVRNEIMHFQREGVSDQDLQNTREFAVFLREIVA